tara:strand:+ start:122 stop:370 length:249 start_codon:yes stop_codon:yes gene_type:complete
MHEEINSDIYFVRGYNKGFSDAQESLARKMSKTIMDDHGAGYDQGVKDCHRILLEQLDEIIDNCRVQDEYAFNLIRQKLFNK